MLRTTYLLFLAVSTPLFASEPGEQKPSGYTTPQEAWDAYRFALHEGRWKEAYECLTADSQERITQGMLFSIAYLQDTAELDTGKKLKAVLKNHGLTVAELETKTDDLAAGWKAYSRLKDKEGLFCEVMNAVRPLGPHPTRGGKPIVEYEKLTNIEIAGDNAEGHYIRQMDDKYETFVSNGVRQTEVKQDEEFSRINGRWFVGKSATAKTKN